jgi:flagellar motor switch protein FliM
MSAERYDFTKPRRLTPQWHKQLCGWVELSFALANKAWTKQLPFAVEASLVGLEVCYAQPALAALPEKTAAYRILLADRRVTSFFALPRETVLKLIGTMIGDAETAIADRDLTLIDENLAEYFLIEYVLPHFRETWPGAEVVSWELLSRELNPQCSRVYSANEVLIAVNFQLRGSWGESKGVWLFPKTGLVEIITGRKEAPAPVIPEPVLMARRQALMETMPLALEVVIGSAEMKLAELSHLQVGDVLLLDNGPDDALIARAGVRDLFRGKAGRQGTAKAFQIESINES